MFDTDRQARTPAFDWLTKGLAIVELDASALMPFECQFHLDHHDRVLVHTWAPLCGMAVLLAVSLTTRWAAEVMALGSTIRRRAMFVATECFDLIFLGWE